MRSKLFRTTLTTLFICFLLSFSTSVFAAETRLEKAIPEGGTAVLTFAADPLLTMTETPFSVKLTGSTGKVFSDAAVSLRLIMPAMSMPINKPKALWQDDAYKGLAIFTMAGEWDAIMIIQRPGHDVIDLTFKLGQVQMK
ncbi:MAG: FixH family protein [Desulfuromonadales bacterium]|nr:FixH family protein [Desulfuromonadales bacterium]